jgi:hypothetical protein
MINNPNRISKTDATEFKLAGDRTSAATRPIALAISRRVEPPGFGFRHSLRRRAVTISTKAGVILLSSTLFIGAAAAQTPHGPIVDGDQLQPTQEQFKSTNDKNVVEWDRWNSRVQPDIAI